MKLSSIVKSIITEASYPASLAWTDGKSIKLNPETGIPEGVEFLGDIESPSKDAPKASDWHTARMGKDEYLFWSPSLKKAFKSKVASMLVWGDGLRVDMDDNGNPIGYEYLGWLNSGIKLPDAKDWREFYSTSRGHHKSLSPSLKKWFQVDSGD